MSRGKAEKLLMNEQGQGRRTVDVMSQGKAEKLLM